MKVQIKVSTPTVQQSSKSHIVQDDVFGKNLPVEERGKYVFATAQEPMKFWPCNHMHLARVVIVPFSELSDAQYWLEYVYGADCVRKTKRVQIDKGFDRISELNLVDIKPKNNGNYVAIYATYMCW